jgi:hypothetical protein
MLFITISAITYAQTKEIAEDTAYTRVIQQRADKIVKTLTLNSPDRATRVRNIIANQYRHINALSEVQEAKLKAITAQGEEKQAVKNELDNKLNTSLDSLQKIYITQLSTELDKKQIEQVKDGMTYNILPITYKGYQEMIPNLTMQQKQQILTWLTEAREHAMSAGSSDKKHWWFGKYKGRINNYLSSEGYDLKKEGEEWSKRRKESGKS